MRKILCSLVLSVVFTSAALAFPPPTESSSTTASPSRTSAGSTPDPVKGCPTGLVCFTLHEQARIDKRLAELDKLKKTKHVLGFHYGCGPVLGGVVDKDFNTRLVPALGCGAVFGW